MYLIRECLKDHTPKKYKITRGVEIMSVTFIVFVSIMTVVLFSVMVCDLVGEKRAKKRQKEEEFLRTEAERQAKEFAKARAAYIEKVLNDRGSDVYERRWVDDWWREQP